jgi:hypothetical protein
VLELPRERTAVRGPFSTRRMGVRPEGQPDSRGDPRGDRRGAALASTLKVAVRSNGPWRGGPRRTPAVAFSPARRRWPRGERQADRRRLRHFLQRTKPSPCQPQQRGPGSACSPCRSQRDIGWSRNSELASDRQRISLVAENEAPMANRHVHRAFHRSVSVLAACTLTGGRGVQSNTWQNSPSAVDATRHAVAVYPPGAPALGRAAWRGRSRRTGGSTMVECMDSFLGQGGAGGGRNKDAARLPPQRPPLGLSANRFRNWEALLHHTNAVDDDCNVRRFGLASCPIHRAVGQPSSTCRTITSAAAGSVCRCWLPRSTMHRPRRWVLDEHEGLTGSRGAFSPPTRSRRAPSRVDHLGAPSRRRTSLNTVLAGGRCAHT